LYGRIKKPYILYDVLIEMMQNTIEHAGKGQKLYSWTIFAFNNPENKTSYMTFVDLGVGIFMSQYVDIYRKIMKFVRPISNTILVEDLFSGLIGSRTREPERGKGLPEIKYIASRTIFEKFMLLSNNVLYDLKNSVARDVKSNFKGTLYYMEIKETNA
jgi:hypothetical protein